MLFTLGMVAFALLLGPASLLALGLIGRFVLRRGASGGAAGGLPRPIARIGCGVLLLLPVCAFGGIMVASAGGAIHPPLVSVAAPYVCDGTVETQSRSYSYRPGQQGVAHTISCLDADGARRDITLRAIGAASLYYSLILLAAALALWGLMRLLKPRRPGGGGQDAETLRRYLAERLRTDADIVRRRTGSADDIASTGDTNSADAGSPEDRLRRLQALRDGGLISEAEYQAKRADILAGL